MSTQGPRGALPGPPPPTAPQDTLYQRLLIQDGGSCAGLFPTGTEGTETGQRQRQTSSCLTAHVVAPKADTKSFRFGGVM